MTPDELTRAAQDSTNDQPLPTDLPDDSDIPQPIGGDWKDLLVKQGPAYRPCILNIDIALRYSPEWDGVFAFDEFKHTVVTKSTPPTVQSSDKGWQDEDDTRASLWMQTNGIYVTQAPVGSVIQSIAREHSFHPIRDYLKSLHWDGEPRVDSWLSVYLGATQSAYLASIGRMWLISAVARILSPGCQVDHMLVLEGDQGIKKSSALEVLAGKSYFCDQLPDITTKDASMQTMGSWIIEWAELDAMSKTEVTSVKSFITRRVEKFRPPYGHHTIEVPRQCVFAGTTNAHEYLRDETGNRRFWPVKCTSIDIEALKHDRDQLWAETVALFDDNTPWWPSAVSAAVITQEQDDRVSEDLWREKIQTFLDSDASVLQDRRVTIPHILNNCFNLSTLHHTQVEKNRIGRVLKSLRWEYHTWRANGVKQSGYVAPLA